MVSMERDSMSSVLARLRSQLPAMKPSHAKVIEQVISDPQPFLNATASQIADRAKVSPATVVRAVRAAGFEGLPQMKMVLARAVGTGVDATHVRALHDAETPSELTETITASHVDSLTAVRGTLDPGQLGRAADILRRASRVLVTGAGTSLAVAADAAYRLSVSGLAVQHSADSYSSVVLAGLLGTRDAIIAVSHSGETDQTLDVVDVARAAGSTVIAVTSFSGSRLARTADIPLLAVGSASAEHLVESSSRIAHLAVIDVLHSALALGVGADESPE